MIDLCSRDGKDTLGERSSREYPDLGLCDKDQLHAKDLFVQ